MAPLESEPQKETVERVMHEYKYGELRSGTSGQKVKSRKQAVAISLREAGASNQQSPKENEQRLRPDEGQGAPGRDREGRGRGPGVSPGLQTLPPISSRTAS